MGGLKWKSSILKTALFVPGFTFSVFFTLNLFMWGAGSSAAVPFTTILVLLFLWLGISLPLTFFGGFLGSRKSINLFAEYGPSDSNASRQTSLKQPVCTEEIPCKDPPLNWKLLSRSILSSLAGGLSVFSCILIQHFYIHMSIWFGQVYYTFGFLLAHFIALLVVCIEVSILSCYCSLCAGNYCWWRRSFFSTSTSVLYFIFFSVLFFIYKTNFTGGLSYLIYFGYTFIMAFLFWILTGSIGFVASLLFVKKIYSTSYAKFQLTDLLETVQDD
jgi:transmembrane 9 superfamily protein 2/4